MAKFADDAFIDGGLDAIDGCTTLSVCTGQPANQAGIAAITLASVVIDAADFTKANGDGNGRKVTVAQQADVAITGTTGDATHVVIDDGVSIFVTTCSTQTLTNGGTVTVPAWDIEISDPT